jgi:hypothetical protein
MFLVLVAIVIRMKMSDLFSERLQWVHHCEGATIPQDHHCDLAMTAHQFAVSVRFGFFAGGQCSLG